jgi:hypothetical protein
MGGLLKVTAIVLIAVTLLSCGAKDEEKASENRPPIPGY